MIIEKSSRFIDFQHKMCYWIQIKNSANIEPTETYHIPNQQKFHEDSDGLLRFEITAWFEGENPILLRPLLCGRPILAIWLKKWMPLNLIICLNQSSCLKSEKFIRILITFPWIWYMVDLCTSNFGSVFWFWMR